ncbi:MAG: Hydrolase, haloacid delahogenase-like family [uncultured Rubellimicrobium sp.]|uniref:Hydrolase, haloacid delahogenase-like family n=1 Tax=uncultured Rubellimicrobium sp. TaxID=543078 RepID=A0A6J4PQE5_9RHOB|nr:MAG: Hydrolase, haloacid delahogenase-like family [uncultured Rubellimicrobium sp.]
MRAWTIGFDADDTLWHNERFFRATEDRFADLLASHMEGPHLRARLLDAERRNLGLYGFGIKGFVLSMIETAVEVTEGRVPGTVVREILAMGRDMLAHPIELLPQAREAVEAAAAEGEVVLITKGDLLHQEQKLAASGLGDLFDAVEIVSDKTPSTYLRIFARHGARRAMMVGNSLKSDVIPAIAAGAWGVHVPHGIPWELEHADPPLDHPRFRAIASLGEFSSLIAQIAAAD